MGNLNSSESVYLRFLDGCPEIPQAPVDDQVQLRFDELLLFACTDTELRDELNSAESIENKWAYAFLSKLPHGKVADEWLDPCACVKLLQRHRSSYKSAHDLFLAIRINILLRPRTWVEKFIEENGIEELVAPFQEICAISTDTCNEVITTLFVLANSSAGIPALVKGSQCCQMLILIVDKSPLSTIKIRVLKLLGMFCRNSLMAQDAVLSALTLNGTDDGSFQSLFFNLHQNYPDIELKFATLKFVNTLLETTTDKKRRATIRHVLKTHEIRTLLESLKSQYVDSKMLLSSSMEVQLKVFFKNYDDTEAEDNLGAFRSVPGKTLQCSLGQSGHENLMETILGSNQGENDEASDLARLEELIDNSAILSARGVNTSLETDNLNLALAFSSTENSSLSNILNQLRQQSQILDRQTNEKLANLLQKLVLKLCDESQATKAVDCLITSLCSDDYIAATSDVKSDREPDLLTRVSMALFPSYNESSTPVVKPPTSGRATFFSGFGEFSLSSLSSSTPSKNTVSRPSLSSFLGAESSIRSMDQPAARNAKLSLPFFQNSRKGPGVGVTPACTPVATASVRKDAKRPVFPTFPSPPKKISSASSHANENSAALPLSFVAAPLVPSLPLIEIAPKNAPLKAVKPLVIEPDISTNDGAVDALVPDTDILKFRKLLAMGVPHEAVRLKMQQAGVSADLLEEQQGFSSQASRNLAHFKTTRLDTSESLGASLKDGKAKISQMEFKSNSSVAFVKFNELSCQKIADQKVKKATSEISIAGPVFFEMPVKVKDDPEYAKFFKLRSMGAPSAAVKAKMVQAGLQSELLDTPDACVPNKAATTLSEPKVPHQTSHALPLLMIANHTAPPSGVHLRIKNEPQYAKFFKLLAMGAPADSVKAKMQMAGLRPELLDSPDATFDSSSTNITALQPQLKIKDDTSYAKFFKLLSMGAPVESVKAKMQMAGLNPDLLDTPDASVLCGDMQAAGQAQVKVKDDPAYSKFFKLFAMGAPAESVKAKMRMAGLQEDFLDTPDAFLSSTAPVTQSAPPAPITTAARRAHLSIAIKPALKAKTRAFYWQHLKDEAIQGTIWEELEKEHGNQSNQELIILSESELKVLETEFPPPAACGPGTGSRRGVGSGFLSPEGPASPLASPKIVFLIDRARSNNISIIIKQFKMSNAALRVAIMRMDSEILTLDRVQGLIKMLPTEDEIVAISSFNGDPMMLNGAELVLKELITVPRLKQRLSALETKHQFPTLVRDLQSKINKIRTASREIAQSSELKAILIVVLQVGNKMNQDTTRGGAKGFRLSDLTKLVQLKSVDKSITLLHYIARMIRAKKSNVVRLGDSLASLYDVQSISIPELYGDMNKITDITESINVELAAQRLKNRIEEKEESDLFVETMTTFVDNALQDVTTLKSELDETLRLVRDIMSRFDKSENEEVDTAPNGPLTPATLSGASEFYSIIYEFTMSLMKVDRENESKRIREEKRLKQQELKNATPRKSSIERSKFIGKLGFETPESSQLKSILATSSIAKAQSKHVLSTFAEALTNSSTTTPEASEESILSCESLSAANKLNGDPIVIVDTLVEEKLGPKRTETRISALKSSESLLKPSALPSVPASPLKKVIGIIPTGILSPMKVKRTGPSASFAEKGLGSNRLAVPFDAASLNKIKSQLKRKHGANNEPQRLQGLKPEVEVVGDDHENNNSEPSSPERALSEADSSFVAVQSDA